MKKTRMFIFCSILFLFNLSLADYSLFAQEDEMYAEEEEELTLIYGEEIIITASKRMDKHSTVLLQKSTTPPGVNNFVMCSIQKKHTRMPKPVNMSWKSHFMFLLFCQWICTMTGGFRRRDNT